MLLRHADLPAFQPSQERRCAVVTNGAASSAYGGGEGVEVCAVFDDLPVEFGQWAVSLEEGGFDVGAGRPYAGGQAYEITRCQVVAGGGAGRGRLRWFRRVRR